MRQLIKKTAISETRLRVVAKTEICGRRSQGEASKIISPSTKIEERLIRKRSKGTLAPQDDEKCLYEDIEVEPDGVILDVVKIVFSMQMHRLG